LLDGVKIIHADRWVQARGSNTEPIIRVTAEAPSEADAHALLCEIMAQLEIALGGVSVVRFRVGRWELWGK
jgi:phosphomannomutase